MGPAYVHVTVGAPRLGHLLTLLRALILREWKGRYRRSLLGPVWAILQPLIYLLVFMFIRAAVGISSEGVPYPLFVYTALVLWTFLSNSIAWCGPSVLANRGIVKKMNIPREAFPTTSVLTSVVDFAIAFALLVAMLAWYVASGRWSPQIGLPLIWLPLLVALTALLALGIGLVSAGLGTYKRDIMFGIPFLLQFWMLASPIMYPLSEVPARWKDLYALNPMVGLIESFRGAILHNAHPDPYLLTVSVLGIAVIWLVALPLFRYLSQYFADVL